MMAEGFRDDLLDSLDAFRGEVVGRMKHDGRLHRYDDFSRVRFHHYECDKCRHSIGPQQVAILKELDKIEAFLKAEDYADVGEAVQKVGVEP